MLLIPIAVTSTNAQVKRLGGKRWKQLHRSVYVVNALIALHFIFAANHENGEPYIYVAVVLMLLLYRAGPLSRWPWLNRLLATPSAVK